MQYLWCLPSCVLLEHYQYLLFRGLFPVGSIARVVAVPRLLPPDDLRGQIDAVFFGPGFHTSIGVLYVEPHLSGDWLDHHPAFRLLYFQEGARIGIKSWTYARRTFSSSPVS